MKLVFNNQLFQLLLLAVYILSSSQPLFAEFRKLQLDSVVFFELQQPVVVMTIRSLLQRNLMQLAITVANKDLPYNTQITNNCANMLAPGASCSVRFVMPSHAISLQLPAGLVKVRVLAAPPYELQSAAVTLPASLPLPTSYQPAPAINLAVSQPLTQPAMSSSPPLITTAAVAASNMQDDLPATNDRIATTPAVTNPLTASQPINSDPIVVGQEATILTTTVNQASVFQTANEAIVTRTITMQPAVTNATIMPVNVSASNITLPVVNHSAIMPLLPQQLTVFQALAEWYVKQFSHTANQAAAKMDLANTTAMPQTSAPTVRSGYIDWLRPYLEYFNNSYSWLTITEVQLLALTTSIVVLFSSFNTNTDSKLVRLYRKLSGYLRGFPPNYHKQPPLLPSTTAGIWQTPAVSQPLSLIAPLPTAIKNLDTIIAGQQTAQLTKQFGKAITEVEQQAMQLAQDIDQQLHYYDRQLAQQEDKAIWLIKEKLTTLLSVEVKELYYLVKQLKISFQQLLQFPIPAIQQQQYSSLKQQLLATRQTLASLAAIYANLLPQQTHNNAQARAWLGWPPIGSEQAMEQPLIQDQPGLELDQSLEPNPITHSC